MNFSHKRYFFLIFLPLFSLTRLYCYGGLNNISPTYRQYEVSRQACCLMNPDSDLASIRELRVAQQYGDPIYDKFDPYSLVRFYGFTGLNMSTRTRQAVISFQIASLLFPAAFIPDVNGRDINDHGFTFISAYGVRLGAFFNPFNANSWGNIYGILEFDFSGTQEGTAYCAKIRHSFGELVWYSGSFLWGQYYHPLFLRDCFPKTVSYNAGAPFEPQALVPQVRLDQFWGDHVEFTFAMAGEAYIQSFGPGIGASNTAEQSNVFIQDAIVPNFHFQLKLWDDESFIGGALDYKRLCPRLVSANDFKVNEHIDSIITEAFIHKIFI